MNVSAVEQLITNNYISEKQVAIENKSLFFNTDGSVEIPCNSCDLFYPLFISSPDKLQYLELLIDDKSIVKFPLEFCNKLDVYANEEEINFSDIHVYKLPWQLLKFKPIPAMRLYGKKIHFVVHSSQSCNYVKCKLYICNLFLSINDSNEIKSLSERKDEIKKFEEMTYKVQSQENKHDFTISGVIKGVFLDNVDFNNITSVKLYFGEYKRFDFNEDMLMLFADKISDNCYYISFDDTSFNNMSWQSSLNIYEINKSNNVSISIKGSEQTIIIRALTYGNIES